MYILPHPLHCHCFPIWKMYSASNYFLVQKETGKRNAELKKSLLKTVVKYKDYVIETGNVYQYCIVLHSTAHNIRPFLSIKAIICLILEAGNML